MKRKEWINACGVLLLSFSICTPVGALDNSNVTGAAFTDIRGFWAEDAISGALHKGLPTNIRSIIRVTSLIRR
ncbi:hypothetical protein GCM10023310_27140 [Paenibacillus vulneris]